MKKDKEDQKRKVKATNENISAQKRRFCWSIIKI